MGNSGTVDISAIVNTELQNAKTAFTKGIKEERIQRYYLKDYASHVLNYVSGILTPLLPADAPGQQIETPKNPTLTLEHALRQAALTYFKGAFNLLGYNVGEGPFDYNFTEQEMIFMALRLFYIEVFGIIKQESQQGIDIEDAVQKINSAVLRAATLKPNAHKLKSRNISIDEIYRCLEGNYTQPITVLRTDAFEPSN